ncbi:MAG TPA: universal stress protein [Blastocatellia bacterium]|nr:universal stress protein [Blastocatellia bacterium]
MKEHTKILLGYDGSDCSERMLWDLQRAGLPQQAEAFVLTVAEHWFAAPTSIGGVDVHFTEAPEEGAATRALTEQAQTRIQSYFPHWDVKAEAMWGTPATKLVEKADDWQPDLLIVGSHGRGVIGRFFLGSVSQKVLHEAHCSVRIARGTALEANTPVRLVIAMDGSKGSMAAVDAVVAREWPAESQVRLVNATWTVPPVTAGRMVAPITDWIAEENARIKTALEVATAKLQGVGLITTTVVEEDEPKDLICEEAERWGADCIFLGARGMGAVERMLIGSISSGVAARAHCSVEVVRST